LGERVYRIRRLRAKTHEAAPQKKKLRPRRLNPQMTKKGKSQ
jgi:hypothetical protein